MLRLLRANTSGTIANTMRRRRQKRDHDPATILIRPTRENTDDPEIMPACATAPLLG